MLFQEIPEDLPYDDVLEVFERVNSGGTRLPKSDLLFSTEKLKMPEIEEKFIGLVDELREGPESFRRPMSRLFYRRWPACQSPPSINKYNDSQSRLWSTLFLTDCAGHRWCIRVRAGSIPSLAVRHGCHAAAATTQGGIDIDTRSPD